jgi:hypothetical protein
LHQCICDGTGETGKNVAGGMYVGLTLSTEG